MEILAIPPVISGWLRICSIRGRGDQLMFITSLRNAYVSLSYYFVKSVLLCFGRIDPNHILLEHTYCRRYQFTIIALGNIDCHFRNSSSSTFFTKGIPKTGIGLANIVVSLEIPVSILSAILILDDNVSYIQWLGVVIILFAVLIINIGKYSMQR